jgi:hypothetical protein
MSWKTRAEPTYHTNQLPLQFPHAPCMLACKAKTCAHVKFSSFIFFRKGTNISGTRIPGYRIYQSG